MLEGGGSLLDWKRSEMGRPILKILAMLVTEHPSDFDPSFVYALCSSRVSMVATVKGTQDATRSDWAESMKARGSSNSQNRAP